jgi:phosphoesterase RecJ-like protein
MVIDMAERNLYGDVAEKLRAGKNIAVLAHNSIDGDTLGSALALTIALTKLGKRATVLLEEKIPENLSMLPCEGYVRQYADGGGDAGGEGGAGNECGDARNGAGGDREDAGCGVGGRSDDGAGDTGDERAGAPCGTGAAGKDKSGGARDSVANSASCGASAGDGSEGAVRANSASTTNSASVANDANVAGGAPAWDILVVVDAGDVGRLGRRARLLDGGACVINIDHHITNQGYGDINLIVSDAAATAELVYHLIRRLGAAMDRDIAVCIYAGICTDTGGFSYNNTTSGCHEIAAEMLRFDLDVNKLHYLFFNAISYGKLRCHGYVANSLKFHYNGRLALVVISNSALEALGATESDCEGLVDIGRNVRGVEVSAMARETKPGEFRINLRSRNDADVSIMAKKFGGGGHTAASGCTINARAEDMEGLIVEAMAYAFG